MTNEVEGIDAILKEARMEQKRDIKGEEMERKWETAEMGSDTTRDNG